MGTNFYLSPQCQNPCEHCNVHNLHIGKRSAGWVFGFQALPGIRSRKDWEVRVAEVGRVSDEYGHEYTPDEFWRLVDETLTPRHNGLPPLTREGMQGRQNIPLDDPMNFVDDQGWDFTEREFS